MKESDLNIQLQEGEGTTLEYKERLSSSLGRELVAMANTLGGRILLGVRDDGTVAGIGDSNSVRARIQDIARNCNPAIQVWLERVGRVIVVHVRESGTKPVQCSEGFFWRQGAVTQKLRREEIRDLFRKERAIRFDLSICPGFRYPEDFDLEKFSAWLTFSRISKPGRMEDVLCNIEAAEKAAERLLFRNAGVLFFAREVRHFFNQAYVTCTLPPTNQVGTKPALSRHQVLILEKSIVEQPLRELMAVTGRTDRTKFRRQVLGPLFQAGYVEMTRPDKPQSSKQCYRITPLGRGALNRESERSHDD